MKEPRVPLDKARKAKRLAPINARTHKQIRSLPRDNLDSRDFWILFDEQTVTIAKQKSGEEPTAWIQIPRGQFARMARWYVTGRTK